MSRTICFNANTIAYPHGGGHRWVYLNWALGLKANGCRVIWMEGVVANWGKERIRELASILRDHLRPYGLAEDIGLYAYDPLPPGTTDGYVELADAVAASDLFLDLMYHTPAHVFRPFKRTALVDIDPGILQWWVHQGNVKLDPRDVYFTIGETVGRPGSNLPDLGIDWHYTPPPVSLDAWAAMPPPPPDAPFTTVSQWTGGDWMVHADQSYSNMKRDGFLPFLDLPRHTDQKLELALTLGEWDADEKSKLESLGWHVRQAATVTGSPADYQRYLQRSRGEFSCCKPSCVRLQNAWISDRTICYLATGRPAIVEHTGPSRFLPDADGLFRFKTMDQAVTALRRVADDYPVQSAEARALATEFFDARKVCQKVLETALP